MTVNTPIETRSRTIPPWAIGITVLIFLVGGVYLAGNLSGENPPIAGAPSPSGSAGGGLNGQALIEEAGCQACHGDDLTGGVGPTLHGLADGPTSENLQDLYAERPDDWANVWIAGTDPAVADPAMRAGMPAFAGPPYDLSDEEIAAIVDYLMTLE
ncbi:MAG TPA: cytochrome c [Candidatus Limnocylindria bacterium]|jgi:mono/diheme cytochrome c family protein